jgi:hypothetical protein
VGRTQGIQMRAVASDIPTDADLTFVEDFGEAAHDRDRGGRFASFGTEMPQRSCRLLL